MQSGEHKKTSTQQSTKGMTINNNMFSQTSSDDDDGPRSV